MGAGTGNQNNRDAAQQQQQAMESQTMRRRALEQQAQSIPNQEQEAPLGAPAPQVAPGPVSTPQPSMGRGPEMRSGINFGPGRANRVPDQGTPEYEQLLQRVRGLGQGQR